MRKCNHCQVEIKGDWETCPLCHRPIDQTETITPSSYPDVPLQFDNQRIIQWLVWLSIFIIFVIFALAFIWRGEIRLLEGTIFGLVTMWLVVLIIVRKRRNLAKSLLYLLVTLSLVCLYFDYLIGWTGWSVTYAIPILCSASLVGMFISIRLVSMKPGDYILYLVVADILGLVPIVFLIFDWIEVTTPAWISVFLSFLMLILIVLFRGSDILGELKKRTFI